MDQRQPCAIHKRFEDMSLDYYGDHEEKKLVETCISNMLYDYRLNLENQCITQFAELLQKTRRIALTIKMKRVLGPQAMADSVREKRKRPKGKTFEEPLVISCTVKELNHVLNKWIEDDIFKSNEVAKPSIEEERKNPLFCRFHNYVQHTTKDCWSLQRLFHKKLREGTLELTQREPKVQRIPLPNHKGKGVVSVVIHGNPIDIEREDAKESFPSNTMRTLQRNPKFRSLFNQQGFGPVARKLTINFL